MLRQVWMPYTGEERLWLKNKFDRVEVCKSF
jgi:hypothetical protein